MDTAGVNRLIQWSAGCPATALAFAVLIAAVLALGCRDLRLEGTTEELFADRAGDFARYDEFRANFGGDEWIVVMASGANLFSEQGLAWLGRLSGSISSLDGVRRLESPFAMERYERRGSWWFLAPLVESGDAFADPEAVRRTLLDDPRCRDRLVSSSGDAICLLVELDPMKSARVGEAALTRDLLELGETARAEAPLGLELDILGVPLIHLEMKEAMARGMPKQVFAVLATVLALLPFLPGRAMLAPIAATSALGAVATFGLIGWLGFPVTLTLFPAVLLVVVISAAEDIYLISDFRDGRFRGLSKTEAAARLGPRLGRTLLITSASSALGFATVAFTANVGFQRFALVGAVGIGLNLLLTALLVPALLVLLPSSRKRIPLGRSLRHCRAALVRNRHRGLCGAVAVLLLVALASGLAKLSVETAFLDYLPKRSTLLERIERFRNDFSGLSFVSVVVETAEEGGALQPGALEAVDRLQAFLEKLGGTVRSPLDLLAKAEEARRGGGGEVGRAEALRGKNLEELFAMVPPKALRDFVDHDSSRAVLKWRIDAPGSHELVELERSVDRYAREAMPPGLEVSVTGSRLLVARFSDRVVRDLLSSLALLSGVVLIFVAIVWRSPILAGFAFVANALPVAAMLGLMGWLGLPLGMGNFHVAIIAFGVAVNDTIHFLDRYQTRRGRTLRDRRDAGEGALRHALREVSLPATATSAALAAGFAAFCFSELGNNRESGMLLAFAMAAAWIADLFVLPWLLSLWKG